MQMCFSDLAAYIHLSFKKQMDSMSTTNSGNGLQICQRHISS